jgi:hypothetical protein
MRAPLLLGLLLVACAAPPRPAPKAPPIAARPSLDDTLRDAWKRAGVVPAPRADDATFLRRAWIDIVGNVPTLEQARAFLDDRSPDKRAKLVDALLASDGYASHWTNYWDDVLIGKAAKSNLVDRGAFRAWLHARFSENTRWDRFATELLTATGQNGIGGKKAPGVGLRVGESAQPETANEDVNGAVNWALRYEQSPQDFGGNAARVFLGVQIQCAQCHDHKTESWKQDDFRKFSSAFFHARVEPIDRGKPMGLRRVALVDTSSAPQRFAKNPELGPIVRAHATALDGTDLEKGTETRKALAAWMTSRDNPWFARAFVNRTWAHFLGRGFYDPIDDVRPSNTPTAPELLDRLTADFVASGFDVKQLVRVVCATEAYQLAAHAGAKTDPENKLWGRFHLAPLGPEELLNAILRVTDLERTAERAGIKNLDAIRASLTQKYAFLFDVDEADDEPDFSGTISQALALLNGALVNQGTRAFPGSPLAELAGSSGTDEEKVDALVLRVLARRATPTEKERFARFVAERAPDEAAAGAKTKGGRDPLDRLGQRRPSIATGYEDLFWVLLNSSEFTFNH